MTAQKGNTCYISQMAGTVATPIVAMRNTQMTVNGQAVVATSRDDNGWERLLAGAGIAKLTLKGDGVVTDDTSFGSLADLVTAQSLNSFQVNFGNAHSYTGSFQLTQFDVKGGYNNEQTYSMQWESSGSLTRV